MSQPYTCTACGYHTAFGSAAVVALHFHVSHRGLPVIEASDSHISDLRIGGAL